jgi:hypothetical protein
MITNAAPGCKSGLDPGGAVALLSRVLADMPRLDGAACAGHFGLFDSDDCDDLAYALTICQECPALDACAQWLVSLPKSCRPEGVVAGIVNRPRPRGRPSGTG